MQRDKFLIDQTKLDDGWVPLTVMLKFKMLASLTKDIDVILKSLENNELIEVSEDQKKIRRRLDKPLPVYDEEYKKTTQARSLYVKGFPTTTNIKTLQTFFEPYSIENIVVSFLKLTSCTQ